MFKNVAPEQVGVSSKKVLEYYRMLKDKKVNLHSLILAKGNEIFAENYWGPFNENSMQRMYSQTKSFVGIAVTELAAEGKISLDDKIVDYFPDKLPENVPHFMKIQTIRNMLTMQTFSTGVDWFGQGVTDRVKHYFECRVDKCPGTVFNYDSEGSFVLGALVERVTNMTFLDYLREKCLDKIGFSKEARCLKAPGGYSWSDSALLCSVRDMLAFGRLLANGGEWDGEQLLDKNAVSEAVKKQVDNCIDGSYANNKLGYGYQIWRTYDDGFAFYGMHDQLMIYNPRTDMILVCTCGNMTGTMTREYLIDGFINYIVNSVDDTLTENNDDYLKLQEYCKNLELLSADGETENDFENEIDGVKFVAESETASIYDFELKFNGNCGEIIYHNAQGEKTLKFGKGYNEYQKFPQTDYSAEIGSFKCEGNMYDCAVSAAWTERKKLTLNVQIIDEYLGMLVMTISFDGDYAVMAMKKHAEDFLDEYNGYITFKKCD